MPMWGSLAQAPGAGALTRSSAVRLLHPSVPSRCSSRPSFSGELGCTVRAVSKAVRTDSGG
eukprot:12290724-Alexandrium_andersonii.AAC.1